MPKVPGVRFENYLVSSVCARVSLIAINPEMLLTVTDPVGLVVEDIASSTGVWGSIPRPDRNGHCRQRLATAAKFLRSCVAEALSFGDVPRYSLHALA